LHTRGQSRKHRTAEPGRYQYTGASVGSQLRYRGETTCSRYNDDRITIAHMRIFCIDRMEKYAWWLFDRWDWG
jgi:hypothetical protein